MRGKLSSVQHRILMLSITKMVSQFLGSSTYELTSLPLKAISSIDDAQKPPLSSFRQMKENQVKLYPKLIREARGDAHTRITTPRRRGKAQTQGDMNSLRGKGKIMRVEVMILYSVLYTLKLHLHERFPVETQPYTRYARVPPLLSPRLNRKTLKKAER